MGLIEKDTFICFDLETTGLDPVNDAPIEIAVVKFTLSETLEAYETLIDPEMPISEVSKSIHHIDESMVVGKPKIAEVLPDIFKMIDRHVLVGHGIGLDVAFLVEAAKRFKIPCSIGSRPQLDTLRLARLYGESPVNSLESLRRHFNIPAEGAHRAMSDVIVNIAVFKQLSRGYKTTEQMLERLKKPIQLKLMPLGKHKGRPFSELPIEYLQWAAHKDFDQDLLFSIRSELKRRKGASSFKQAANPFSTL